MMSTKKGRFKSMGCGREIEKSKFQSEQKKNRNKTTKTKKKTNKQTKP